MEAVVGGALGLYHKAEVVEDGQHLFSSYGRSFTYP
jgi:hypothetical protein